MAALLVSESEYLAVMAVVLRAYLSPGVEMVFLLRARDHTPHVCDCALIYSFTQPISIEMILK